MAFWVVAYTVNGEEAVGASVCGWEEIVLVLWGWCCSAEFWVCCGCRLVAVCADLQCMGWATVKWGVLVGCVFFQHFLVVFLVRYCVWVIVC